jgi:hypothetical protein
MQVRRATAIRPMRANVDRSAVAMGDAQGQRDQRHCNGDSCRRTAVPGACAAAIRSILVKIKAGARRHRD